MMLVRLRPDVAPPSALIQHVAPADPRNVPPVITGYCGTPLRAVDIDPRFIDRLAGCVCPLCAARTPREVVMHLARASGQLWPPRAALGSPVEPVGPYIYARGLAELSVRHIVPDQAPRHPYGGRLAVVAECGHTAWCPLTGPWPSYDWDVCAGCLSVVNRHEIPSCPAVSSPRTG